jgi:hypothetical protein
VKTGPQRCCLPVDFALLAVQTIVGTAGRRSESRRREPSRLPVNEAGTIQVIDET